MPEAKVADSEEEDEPAAVYCHNFPCTGSYLADFLLCSPFCVLSSVIIEAHS